MFRRRSPSLDSNYKREMNNDDYKKLEAAKRVVLDNNMDAIDKCSVRVVSCKIEQHKKFGTQCTIILAAENK